MLVTETVMRRKERGEKGPERLKIRMKDWDKGSVNAVEVGIIS